MINDGVGFASALRAGVGLLERRHGLPVEVPEFMGSGYGVTIR